MSQFLILRDSRSCSPLVPFEPLVGIKSVFRSAEEQPAAAEQGSVDLLEDVHSCLLVEIDHDVAAEDEVEGPSVHMLWRRSMVVKRTMLRTASFNCHPVPERRKYLTRRLAGKPRLTSICWIEAGSGALGDLWQMSVPRIWIFQSPNPSRGASWPGCRLPGRWRTQPTRSSSCAYPGAAYQLRDDHRSQRLVLGRIAEEEGLVGGHGFHHLPFLGPRYSMARQAEIVRLATSFRCLTMGMRRLPASTLIAVEHDAGLAIDIVLQEAIALGIDVGRRHGLYRLPTCTIKTPEPLRPAGARGLPGRLWLWRQAFPKPRWRLHLAQERCSLGFQTLGAAQAILAHARQNDCDRGAAVNFRGRPEKHIDRRTAGILLAATDPG